MIVVKVICNTLGWSISAFSCCEKLRKQLYKANPFWYMTNGKVKWTARPIWVCQWNLTVQISLRASTSIFIKPVAMSKPKFMSVLSWDTWISTNFLALVYSPSPWIKNAHFGWFDALTSPKYKCLIKPLLSGSFTYKFEDAESFYPRFVKITLDEKRWWFLLERWLILLVFSVNDLICLSKGFC